MQSVLRSTLGRLFDRCTYDTGAPLPQPPVSLTPFQTTAGPWWLLVDEPDTMFRLWSTPVHRWLASCIYRPIADYNRTTASATSPTRAEHAGGTGEQPENKQQQGQQQQQQRPPQTGKERRWPWRRAVALLAAFVFSSAVHEAVTYIAMRRTCWPFNSFTLVLATAIISAWDSIYPVKSLISDDDVDEVVFGGTVDDKSVGRTSPVSKYTKAGSKWRGWGAVAFFQGTSYGMGFVVDFLAWQWWRQTLLEK